MAYMKRLYAEIHPEVDEVLTKSAKAEGMTKKAYFEKLITEDSSKKRKKVKKGKK